MGLTLWSRTATEVGTPPQSRGPHLLSARSPPQAGQASSCGTGASWSLRWGRLSPRITDFDITSLLLQVWICSHLTHRLHPQRGTAGPEGAVDGVGCPEGLPPQGRGTGGRRTPRGPHEQPGDLAVFIYYYFIKVYSERTDDHSRDSTHAGRWLGHPRAVVKGPQGPRPTLPWPLPSRDSV